jgi:hypothetical protein
LEVNRIVADEVRATDRDIEGTHLQCEKTKKKRKKKEKNKAVRWIDKTDSNARKGEAKPACK